MKRYYSFLERKNTQATTELDHRLAVQLLESRRTRKKTIVRKKAAGTNGFNKAHVLSEQLRLLLHEEELSRPQVVKRVWEYIKAQGLQDPADKRTILCDDKLRQVFRKSKVNMFEMNKILGNHLFKAEDVDREVQGDVKSESESDNTRKSDSEKSESDADEP